MNRLPGRTKWVAQSHARWPRDPDGAPLYPGDAKKLTFAEIGHRMEAGEPYALRLDMARAIEIAAQKTGEPLAFVETGAGPDGGRW